MSPARVNLGTQELRRLREHCRVRGRHLLPPPWLQQHLPHFTTRTDESEWVRVWHFSSELAAERWNGEWHRVIRRADHLHGALLEIGDQARQEPVVELIALVSAVVLREEVRAGGLYPRMEEGGSYALRVRHTYQRSPHSWARDRLLVHIEGDVCDGAGRLLWTSDARREYRIDDLPTPAPLLLARTAPVDTSLTYP